ncbi:MAG: hypothetical protein LBH04_01340 [Tannerellaceae bacterium]|jgi:hypothetical protein|nr:hypothetical protein [Tannerellaceae bacterium]
MDNRLKYAILFVFLPITFFLTGCENEYMIEEAKDAQRTILVYIAGENSLSGFGVNNVLGMIRGSDGDNLNGGNLLVYLDLSGSLPCLLKISEGLKGAVVDTVKVYAEQNSADVGVMKSVLNDVFRNPKYEAPSKGVILWSHGTAWLPQNPGEYLRAFIQDKSGAGNFWMELSDLREGLSEYKGENRLDFIIFDACYMGNIEVFYALRENADYILASPTEIIADGLPYSQLMGTFFSDKVSVEEMLKETSDRFYNFYNSQIGLAQSASIGLAKMSAMDKLASVSKEIFSGKYEVDALDVPVGQIQILERLGYANNSLFDFRDYVSHVATDEQLERFSSALDSVIVYKATTENAYYGNYPSKTFPINRFCGISSYIPQRNLDKLNEWYKQLDWFKAIYE